MLLITTIIYEDFMKNIELQDKKIWKVITIGIVYFCSIVLLLKAGSYFLEFPLIL